MTKKFKIILAVVSILFVALVVWMAWGNTALELNEYTISSEEIPAQFSGFRIAHISDLHCSQIGKDNKNLLTMLEATKPDIIAITGDLFDESKSETQEISYNFVSQALKIAPCYYVTGNHEARFTEFDTLMAQLTEMGVIVLDDLSVEYTLGNQVIHIAGINDPSFETGYLFGDSASVVNEKLLELKTNNTFQLLLSHRPELFEVYSKNGIDLVLTGHAHGGQFRLPFIGGLFAPNQGFFPEYDSGLYTDGQTQMIVSRGIGNSRFPFRINNRPEIILIELHSA